jgi:hypothetical protein
MLLVVAEHFWQHLLVREVILALLKYCDVHMSNEATNPSWPQGWKLLGNYPCLFFLSDLSPLASSAAFSTLWDSNGIDVPHQYDMVHGVYTSFVSRKW